MGLYQALALSAPRFAGALPPGFKKAGKNTWLITLNQDGTIVGLPTKASDFQHPIPKAPPGRTAGVIATLVVDKASYALGTGGGKARKEHTAYLRVLRQCVQSLRNDKMVMAESVQTLRAVVAFHRSRLGQAISGIKDDDIVVFQVGNLPYLFSDASMSSWLADYLGQKLTIAGASEQCCTCGKYCSPARIAEMVSLFGQRFPISSVNFDAACSAGKKQLFNSPLCLECSANSTSLLSYFVAEQVSENRFNVVLARDKKIGSKEKAGRPLSNQMAVFWTKDEVTIQMDGHVIPAEQAIRLTLDDDETPVSPYIPKAHEGHLKALLESPWHCRGNEVSQVNPVGFYFAILSPNKSRLVIREWMETSIATVKDCLVDYRRAMAIINLRDGVPFVPPLTSILTSLRGPASRRNPHDEKPRLAEIEPELLRQMIRCMYAGAPPPEALLVRAVQAFRAPGTAADEGESFKRLCDRRSALAAAMKFVLTYNNTNNTKAMEQLETTHDADCAYKRHSPYLCGRLLALLNDIQYRSSTSRRGPNTTLVDKFYAAASTAPQSVFGSLLKQANTAHLPKLRKDSSRNYPVKTSQGDVYVTDLLNEIVNLIDADCGLPKQLAPRKQAEFALGYHHQQAVLRPPFASKSAESQPEQNFISNQ